MELFLIWGELGKKYYNNILRMDAKAGISLLIY